MAPADGKKYPARVVDAVSQAFYSRATASPDTARARAQSAYGIASAVAGGLVGGALIAHLSSFSRPVQVLGIAALASWLAAMSLYVHAVAFPVVWPSGPDPEGQDAFIDEVVERAVHERKHIDQRQLRANITAASAMLLTATTFVLALVLGTASPSFPAVVHVSNVEVIRPSALCSLRGNTISGQVSEKSLAQELLRIRPDSGECDRTVTALYIPASAVVRIERTR
jgi:hypothetical protein